MDGNVMPVSCYKISHATLTQPSHLGHPRVGPLLFNASKLGHIQRKSSPSGRRVVYHRSRSKERMGESELRARRDRRRRKEEKNEKKKERKRGEVGQVSSSH